MDGTLTEPRCIIESEMIETILTLLQTSKIGIVTGSDFSYIIEQCQPLFDEACNRHCSLKNLTLYPCNGTKVFKWSPEFLSFKESYSVNMIEELGQDDYNALLTSCLEYQSCISTIHSLPYTGTFLHYRGSMLNWCPIGRSANAAQREAWVNEDAHYKIRERFFRLLKRDIESADIHATVTLGGSTSFDIYPKGWDKTYVLNHVTGHELIFIGDRCKPGGNDYTIYTTLDDAEDHQSYSVSSPAETISLINKYI